MLKKYNRLAKTKEIDRVFKEGGSAFCKHLGVKHLRNDLGFSRFAIVVSAKVSKKAVYRNKIKRRIREIIKQELPTLKAGEDIIIITLPEIRNCSYIDIKKILTQEFRKSSLYKS